MQELLNRGVSTRRGVMAIHRESPYRHEKWDSLLPRTNEVAGHRDDSAPLLHDDRRGTRLL